MMLTDIVKRLMESGRVGIITHIQPDGDALGSASALGLALERLGKRVVILRNDKPPAKYSFIPGSHLVADCAEPICPVETLVVLDCADLERLGDGLQHYKMAGTVLNIDHHISNTMFGNINMVDTNAAATGELVYQIIKLMGIDLNTDIAECIYTAIAADTGCFKYDNTTAVTHGIAGELISIGVESNRICSQIFSLRTLQQTKMLGRAIDSIKTYHGGKTAIMTVTRKMMRETGCSQEDLDGIVEFARDIVGVEVAALLRETDDGGIKVGLRSKEYADTAAIAAAFGGGGHRKASGCTISTSMENAVEQLIKEIEKCYG